MVQEVSEVGVYVCGAFWKLKSEGCSGYKSNSLDTQHASKAQKSEP